jgi:hypothetical protein
MLQLQISGIGTTAESISAYDGKYGDETGEGGESLETYLHDHRHNLEGFA